MEKLWQFIKGHVKGVWSGVVGWCVFWSYYVLPLRIGSIKTPDWIVDAIGFIAGAISTAVLKMVGEWWFDEYGRQMLNKARDCVKFRIIKIKRYVRRKKERSDRAA